jgi:hypothetical protein
MLLCRKFTPNLKLWLPYSGAIGPKDVLVQRYTTNTEAGFSMYSLGLYAQDEWKVNRKLSLTLALRADRNSNETCRKNCISRFNGAFSPADASVPYNTSIATGLSAGFPSLEDVVWEPRVGFAYDLSGNGTTVLRGGGGLFSDLYPGQLVEPFASNPPFTTTFNVAVPGSNVAYGVGNDLNSIGAASYQALVNGFNSGLTYSQIKANLAALGVPFSAPAATAPPNLFRNPKYAEWNLEIQHAFTDKTALTVNYVGNHGYDLIVQDPTVNTYCMSAYCPFQGLPSAAPDPRFGRVVQYTNRGWSNYNGLVASVQQRMKWGFTGQFSYTWSHSLDTISNGGLQSYNLASNGSSFVTQIVPGNLQALNYSNSDYDFRHNLSLNYVWEAPFKSSNALFNGFIGGWTLSGTLFYRTGEPFSVYYGTPQAFLGNAAGNILLANYLGGGEADCTHPSVVTGTQQCLAPSQFGIPTAGNPGTFNFGNVSRNAFRGPNYFNTDLSVVKRFKIRESMAFSLGANFFNILNHPNFANPSGNLASSTFGKILSTETPPSSPYGNFQGAAVSGRLIQTILRFEF